MGDYSGTTCAIGYDVMMSAICGARDPTPGRPALPKCWVMTSLGSPVLKGARQARLTMALTVEEILGDIPSDKRNEPCQENHLCQVAKKIKLIESVAPILRVKSAREIEIKRDWPFDYRRQKLEVLKEWKRKHQSKHKDTYYNLCKALLQGDESQAAYAVRDILRGNLSDSSSDESEEIPPICKKPRYPSPCSEAKICAIMGTTSPEKLVQPVSDSHLCGMVRNMSPSLPLHNLHGVEKVRNALCGQEKAPESLSGKERSTANVSSSHYLTTPNIEVAPMEKFADHLRDIYNDTLPHIYLKQYPTPFIPLRVLKFAMYSVEPTQRQLPSEGYVRCFMGGEVKEVLEGKRLTTLDDFFHLRDECPNVILVEGALGSGKSTLALHIRQKWITHDLSGNFKIVIHIELCDQAYWSADSVIDLLPPHPSIDRKTVVAEMESSFGKEVLFILDGWDDYEPGLQKGLQKGSLLYNLVCSRHALNLHLSTVLVTSRPSASFLLQRYVKSRIILLGFMPGEEDRLFELALNDHHAAQKLQRQLREHPIIASLCYRPLFATVIANEFIGNDYVLPTPHHELLSAVVLGCVNRNLMKRECQLSFMDQLIRDNTDFQRMCTLAYKGSLSNQVTFSLQDLSSCELARQSVQGLMQVQVKDSYSPESGMMWYFHHNAIQHLLSALHVCHKLTPSKQVECFAGSRQCVSDGDLDAIFHLFVQTAHSRKKPFLKLVQHLCTTKNESFCRRVASALNGELVLSGEELKPSVCASVGYFLSILCMNDCNFKVDLSNCSLNDSRIERLVKGLDNRPGHLTLKLYHNAIREGGSRFTEMGHSIEF